MDDQETFGPVWHELGFGEAVERDLLSDYKVLILAVDEGTVAAQFQQQWASGDVELDLDDTARLVGCWNGLAKEHLADVTGGPMRRAVAFAGNIKASQTVAGMFEQVAKEWRGGGRDGRARPRGRPAGRVEARRRDVQRAGAQQASRVVEGSGGRRRQRLSRPVERPLPE